MAHLNWVLGMGLLGAVAAGPALGQSILPDGSLGAEGSVLGTAVVEGFGVELIEGGAVRGPNLFHSFEAFGVGAENAVYFANPVGIEQIFGRVTGDAASRIDGTLGVLGGADLFLLNPNGVVFGPGARLDLTGTFAASTGASFEFGEGLGFSAVELGAAPLLTVGVRSGLQVGAGAILAEGALSATGGLALAGGSVEMVGPLDVAGGMLVRSGGDVQLGDYEGGSLHVLAGGEYDGWGCDGGGAGAGGEFVAGVGGVIGWGDGGGD